MIFLGQLPRKTLRSQLGLFGETEQEIYSVPEHLSGFCESSLAVSSSYDDLGSDAESEADHEQDHVIYDGDRRRTQLHFTDPSQKGSVGQTDHLFHDQTDKDGICHPPYVPI